MNSLRRWQELRRLRFTLPLAMAVLSTPLLATDHNEPDYLNSIFKDVKPDASDLYGVFGYPQDGSDGKRVVALMTFAPAPAAGKFDKEVVHRMLMVPASRLDVPDITEIANAASDPMGTFQRVMDVINKDVGEVGRNLTISLRNGNMTEFRIKYGKNKAGADAARVTIFSPHLQVDNKPVTIEVEANKVTTYNTQYGDIKIFIGGRDDPFFTDLGGFFRSINYLPALEAPGTKGPNHCFPQEQAGSEKGSLCPNFSVNTQPREANRVKSVVILDQNGEFAREPDNKLRGVYSGTDSRANLNANAIAIEFPTAVVVPDNNPSLRQIRIWGEGYRRKPGGYLVKVPASRWVYLPTGQLSCSFPNLDNQFHDISSLYLRFNADRSEASVGFKRQKFGFDQESPQITISAEKFSSAQQNAIAAIAAGKSDGAAEGELARSIMTSPFFVDAFSFTNAGPMSVRNCR